MICLSLLSMLPLFEFLAFSAGGLLLLALFSEVIDNDYRRF